MIFKAASGCRMNNNFLGDRSGWKKCDSAWGIGLFCCSRLLEIRQAQEAYSVFKTLGLFPGSKSVLMSSSRMERPGLKGIVEFFKARKLPSILLSLAEGYYLHDGYVTLYSSSPSLFRCSSYLIVVSLCVSSASSLNDLSTVRVVGLEDRPSSTICLHESELQLCAHNFESTLLRIYGRV